MIFPPRLFNNANGIESSTELNTSVETQDFASPNIATPSHFENIKKQPENSADWNHPENIKLFLTGTKKTQNLASLREGNKIKDDGTRGAV